MGTIHRRFRLLPIRNRAACRLTRPSDVNGRTAVPTSGDRLTFWFGNSGPKKKSDGAAFSHARDSSRRMDAVTSRGTHCPALLNISLRYEKRTGKHCAAGQLDSFIPWGAALADRRPDQWSQASRELAVHPPRGSKTNAVPACGRLSKLEFAFGSWNEYRGAPTFSGEPIVARHHRFNCCCHVDELDAIRIPDVGLPTSALQSNCADSEQPLAPTGLESDKPRCVCAQLAAEVTAYTTGGWRVPLWR